MSDIGLSVLAMNNPFFKEIADSMAAEAAKPPARRFGLPVLAVVPHLFGTTAFRETNPLVASYVWAAERALPWVYRDVDFEVMEVGSTIGVETEVGKGSTFKIRLPIHRSTGDVA